MRSTSRLASMGVCALAALLAGTAARADPHRYALDALYRSECGACHVAYPPALLDSASWRSLLDGLERHFGSDASVDASTKSSLAATLQRDSRSRAAAPPGGEPRLTSTPWFRREHRELSSAVFTSPAVRSAANCEACHAGAADGDYAEAAVRVPVIQSRGTR